MTAVERRLTFPATEDAVRSLRAGDVLWADGEAIGMRDRTHVRIFEERRSPPFDLAGALVLHTAPNVRRLGPGRYEPVSVGTTTSARMARYTEALARDHGVRAICGKGGLPDEAIDVMRRYGLVYLALVGGTAALETRQIEAIEEVAWEDLMPECLWRFRVRGLGPLTVGIDARGGSLYRDVRVESERRLEDLLARL